MKTFRTKVSLSFDPWLFSNDPQLTVVMPLPRSDGMLQVLDRQVSQEGILKTDAYGNAVQVCSIDAGETITVNLDIEETAFKRGVSHYDLPGPVAEDIAPAPLIPITEPIRAKAAELIAAAPHEPPAEVFFRYVRDRMTYEHPMSDMGAETTLQTLKGDCGDFSLLFCGLCRATNIPARPVFGWMIAPWFVGPHVWAEVFVDNEWLPVDASMAQRSLEFGPLLEVPSHRDFYFGNLDQYRLALSRGTGIGAGWAAEVFSDFRKNPNVEVTPGMTVDGTPFDFFGELRDGSIPYLQLPYTLIAHPKPEPGDEEELFKVKVKPYQTKGIRSGLGLLVQQADAASRKPEAGIFLFLLWSFCQGVFKFTGVSASVADAVFFVIAALYLPWALMFTFGWLRKLRFIRLNLSRWRPSWSELSTLGIDVVLLVAVVGFARNVGERIGLPI